MVATHTPRAPGPAASASVFVASWFGVGFLPWAPGTWGSAAALPLAWWSSRQSLVGQVALVGALVLVAIPCAGRAGRILGVVDARPIVIDEVAGVLVSLLGVRFSWATAAAGFGLFRLFDVLKPWPASFFDRRVKNGAGVVLDDVAAGLYARGALALLALAWPGRFG